jgi:hypothetical protein
MPQRRVPHDAFDFYFALGPSRSYEQVASRFGFSKRAIVKVAARERWQARIEQVEAEARVKADRKKSETLEVEKEHHLQALRLVLGKGIEALRAMAITEPMDAVRAIGLAVREIRVELGEPSDRTAVSIEDVIKREYERWMTAARPEPERNEGTPEQNDVDD